MSADSMLNSTIPFLAEVDKDIADASSIYMSLDMDVRKRSQHLAPLYGADTHLSVAVIGETGNKRRMPVMRSGEGTVDKVWRIVLNKDEMTQGGNPKERHAIIALLTANLPIADAYERTRHGNEDHFNKWPHDDSVMPTEETPVRLFVVQTAQADEGGYSSESGARKAAQANSYIRQNNEFRRISNGLFKSLKGLIGETVPFAISGNVVYSLKQMPSGLTGFAYVPFNNKLVGVGEKTYTNRRGQERRANYGPMEQIATVGSVNLGRTVSA
jgi:hypothetical protein